MDPERPKPVSLSIYSDTASELRRVARLLPGLTANGIGLRALRAGLPLVERELVEAAQRVVDEHEVKP